MPETLYATSHITGSFTNPTNAVGSGAGTWAGALNTSTNATSRWAIGDPVDPLTASATQTIAVQARKGSNSGTPTIALNLYENGTLVRQIGSTTNVTSTTGQAVTGTFTSSEISDRTAVEIEVVMTAAGGSPSVRNSAQVDYIQWTADTTAAATYTGSAAQTLPALTQSAAGTAAPPTATGSAAQTLPGVSQSASGTHTVPTYTGSAGQSLPPLGQSSAGTHQPPSFTGSAVQTLPSLGQAATGTVGPPAATGSASQTLPALSQQASGEVFAPVYSGEMVQILPALGQQSTGTFTAGGSSFTGTIAQSLAALSQLATGQFTEPVYVGSANQELPALEQHAWSQSAEVLVAATSRAAVNRTGHACAATSAHSSDHRTHN